MLETTASPPVVPGSQAAMKALLFARALLMIIGLPLNKTVTTGMSGSP